MKHFHRKPSNSAQEISYSRSAQSRGGRALIRVMENATGRRRLIRRAKGYETEIHTPHGVWPTMMRRYGLSLEILSGAVQSIPRTGPVILVSNHPFGILDGLVMGAVLSALRDDFKIVANRVFHQNEILEKVILPISFAGTKNAISQNIAVRREALSFLNGGGAVGIFPGGTVATSAKPFGQPLDPVWRNFTAKMVLRSDAVILPLYFHGCNSRLFQLASHLHPNLRLALLIKEFKARTDRPVPIAIGNPIDRTKVACFQGEPGKLMAFLRKETYALSPQKVDANAYGYEFEEQYRI